MEFENLQSGTGDFRPISGVNEDTAQPVLLLDEVMATHIRGVLSITRGKVQGKNGAATLLGIHPNTLRNRMDKLKIPYGRKAN